MPDYNELVSLIGEMRGAVVGYSGGIDSTLVAKAATDALGENARSVLIDSCFMPRSEIDEAVALAERLGLNLVRIGMDPLSISNVPDNKTDRCYHCKRAVFSVLIDLAQREGLEHVLDGTNADDMGDFRPGEQAVRELGVRSPLKELGWPKSVIREISRQIGLPTWDKPSYACLASRVPFGTRLTREILGQVEAAESILHELGFSQCRVRHHGNMARIELMPDDMEVILSRDMRNLVSHRMRALGFRYVALDLLGYRMGSMNEPLIDNDVNVKEWGVADK